MREIVLDTETTGLDPKDGHRLVEIGCVELVNHLPTGRTYHQYLNPEREVPAAAFEVHGLSNEFLSKFPSFSDCYQAFMSFIEDSPLVIHNAAFDMKFLHAELASFVSTPLVNKIVDTLLIARKAFPGSPASLDALCKRFKVDNSQRVQHGALLDAEILAEVYLELLGGRQIRLFKADDNLSQTQASGKYQYFSKGNSSFPRRIFSPKQEEVTRHREYLKETIRGSWWLSHQS